MKIYLDNILPMGATMEDILIFRETVVFYFQQLGFILNLEKSILNPVHLLKKNIESSDAVYRYFNKGMCSNFETDKVAGTFNFDNADCITINYRYLRREQIEALKCTRSYL